jgi:hypothetical protein
VENKIQKNTIPCKISTTVNPTKHNVKQTRIELIILDFHPGLNQALLAYGRHPITFPFWEYSPLVLPPGSPFALQLWAMQVNRGLALTGMYFTDVYLGSETTLGRQGE